MGIVIGTKMAFVYVNLFMDFFERKLFCEVRVKLDIWWRYIDYIFVVWIKGEKEFIEFLNYINIVYEIIKFIWNWSRDKINFLDV